METSILVTKPKQLNASDKEVLRKAGVIVIEAEDTQSIRFIKPNAEISGSDMFRAAMAGIARGNDTTTMREFSMQIAAMSKANHEGA